MESEKPRRRLPVLNAKDDDAPEERPAWHWVVLGAAATLLVWLLLASLVNSAIRGASPFIALVANALALGLSAALAGAMIGRFGTKAGIGHATAAGAITAAFGCALALKSMTASAATAALTFVLAIAIAAAGAAAGHRLTRRRVRA
ncbi:MAG: hypothetical protein HOV80_32120 [Polyangiaceae bacterium]|nr:hypothetical protein [Polyangiaceae bacterium]